MSRHMFLLGAGFTKAAIPNAPINCELVSSLGGFFGSDSVVSRYQEQYGTDDIEAILTRLDIEARTNHALASDRTSIDKQLAMYFETLRFSVDALNKAPWLNTFATRVLQRDDIIVTLNYDCFLEGLLDYLGVWSPNGGYMGVDNILVDGEVRNQKDILLYKIHGSENFRKGPFFDRPQQDAISYVFNEGIFPVSAKDSSFGGGMVAGAYIIAPSFVKVPHRQISLMMLDLLDAAKNVDTLVVAGCGLRPEDAFLRLLLANFLRRKNRGHENRKRLAVVDLYPDRIRSAIENYWVGDLNHAVELKLFNGGLESSCSDLADFLDTAH